MRSAALDTLPPVRNLFEGWPLASVRMSRCAFAHGPSKNLMTLCHAPFRQFDSGFALRVTCSPRFDTSRPFACPFVTPPAQFVTLCRCKKTTTTSKPSPAKPHEYKVCGLVVFLRLKKEKEKGARSARGQERRRALTGKGNATTPRTKDSPASPAGDTRKHRPCAPTYHLRPRATRATADLHGCPCFHPPRSASLWRSWRTGKSYSCNYPCNFRCISVHKPPFHGHFCGIHPETKTARNLLIASRLKWLRGRDLNPRPSGYEPDELPGCSTPRFVCATVTVSPQGCKRFLSLCPPRSGRGRRRPGR